MKEPIRVVAIGAGNRMRTYMTYVREHPDEVVLTAVVEPDDVRRNEMADLFALPAQARFRDYSHFFSTPRTEADAVIIATPEALHFEPAMMAIRQGMHVLLEKPIAQTYEECEAIARAARERGLHVGVCHVLRYMPCFQKMKQVVDSGRLGRIMSIRHTERVGIDRMAHSYVRGVFSQSKKSNPMLLSKCCHDIDFLLWLVNSPCCRVSSFGSLSWFRSENAPKGAALRCIDCPVERSCPYSAVDLYCRRREWISNFDVPEGKALDDVLHHELHEGQYGRCVYHCDNDVVDHQTTIFEMADHTTISLDMTAFTKDDHRSTAISLTEGEIFCNEACVTVRHFLTGKEERFDFSEEMRRPYHGGADFAIMEDFLATVRGRTAEPLASIDEALLSHRLCFEAERSRLTGETVDLTQK